MSSEQQSTSWSDSGGGSSDSGSPVWWPEYHDDYQQQQQSLLLQQQQQQLMTAMVQQQHLLNCKMAAMVNGSAAGIYANSGIYGNGGIYSNGGAVNEMGDGPMVANTSGYPQDYSASHHTADPMAQLLAQYPAAVAAASVAVQNNVVSNFLASQMSHAVSAKENCKPKGPLSAYIYFVQTCREEHKKKHPNETVVLGEFSRRCSDRWQTMDDNEKKRFFIMADADKKRYAEEMLRYVPPKGEKVRGRKKKQAKDPNAPKRPLSAFFWFCGDERPVARLQFPDYGVGDIAKELGKRWGKIDLDLKRKYEAKAEEDKARYEKDMALYKKSLEQPVIQTVEISDDEEDDYFHED